MSAIDIINNILYNNNLSTYQFKYCLVTKDKIPYTINNTMVKPNNVQDFCDLYDLVSCMSLDDYVGIGISIQASNICAIDVDHCFEKPFDINTCDDRGKQIIELFKNKAYIEYSFSGTGLRLLFKADNIKNYIENYYIKNDKTHCEFYQPSNPARYVTITGKFIYNNPVINDATNELHDFLDTFMKRQYKLSLNQNITDTEENRSYETLMKLVKSLYRKNFFFQDIWFDTKHLSDYKGQSLESHKDFTLCKYLYDHITKNKDMLKKIFESSPYFKTKDQKHIYKWEYNNNRYYNYMYARL